MSLAIARPQILLGESMFSDAARSVLAASGDVLEFESLERLMQRLPEADAIVVGFEVSLQKPVLDQADRLRVIATRTSRLTHIDVAEAQRRGIAVLSNEPEAPALVATSSTAELAMAMTLALARRLPWAFDSVRAGRWERVRYGGEELKGKTMGVIGFGRLGRKMVGYATAFGMHVVVSDPGVPQATIAASDCETATLGELLTRADVVSLHASPSADGLPILRSEHFELMKPSALLVNTARGELVDEHALLTALRERRLAGAAIDTLAGEEAGGAHLAGNPLLAYAKESDNLLILPHLGGATREATERTQLYIAERLAEYLRANA